MAKRVIKKSKTEENRTIMVTLRRKYMTNDLKDVKQ